MNRNRNKQNKKTSLFLPKTNNPIMSLYILCLLIECWLKQKLRWAELGNVRGCCWRLLAAVWWSLPDGRTHSGSSSTPALPEYEETKTDTYRIPSPHTHFGLRNEVDQSEQNHIQVLLLWYTTKNKHTQEWMKSLHKMGLQISSSYLLYRYSTIYICITETVYVQVTLYCFSGSRQGKIRGSRTKKRDAVRPTVQICEVGTWTRMTGKRTQELTQLNVMFLSWGKCFLFLTLSQKVEQWLVETRYKV